MIKIFKKSIGILLVISILSVLFIPMVSAREIDRDCPLIYIHGLMSSTVYIDKTHPELGEAWPPKPETIINAVKNSIPDLAKYVIDKNADKLADALIPDLLTIFQPAMLDNEGNPVGNSGVIFNYPTADKLKNSKEIDFKYDWRIDPIEIAAQLNDFINYVLRETGSEQVVLKAHSLGGAVMLTYLTLYGNSKVKSVAFNATAVYGETYTGELFSDELVLTGDAITKYMRYAFSASDYNFIMNSIFHALQKAGLTDLVCKIGNDLAEKLSPKILPEVIVPFFAGWLTIWAMVPDEYLDTSMENIFNVIYKDKGSKYDVLKSKIENFNEKVRKFKTEKLIELNKTSNVYVISRYGYSCIPVTPSYLNSGDGVIDTKYSSFGATVAPYGKKLENSYLKNVDKKYISPDKDIDASTVLFPEQTWFIKNLGHGTTPDAVDEMIDTLLYTDFQATVDTYEKYPRFLTWDNKTETISPTVYINPIDAFISNFYKFIQKLIETIASLINKIH